MKPIIQSLNKDSFYPAHGFLLFLFKESEMKNPTYFLIITTWGEKKTKKKRFIFSTLKSYLFGLLNNFLDEMDRKVLNFRKNLCINIERFFCLCGYCVFSRFCHVRLCVTPWTVARQAPLFTGLSRQEYWSGLPCPPPGGLPNPGIQPVSLMSPELAGRFFTTGAMGP